MTNEQQAAFLIEQLGAIGFDAKPILEYGAPNDKERDEHGRVYTGGVYVQQKKFEGGEMRTLVSFAEYHGRCLKIKGANGYNGVQLVNVYVLPEGA